MDLWVRSDYQRVVLYIVTSVSVLLALKYLLPYFLPLLVAFVIVLPLQHFCQRREKHQYLSGKKKLQNKTVKKGFMAGGILFGLMLVIALILVGLGTFLVSKARTIVQDAEFWRNGIDNLISQFSRGIEDFFQLDKGTVQEWILERIQALGIRLSETQDGLWSGGLKYLSAFGRFGTFVVVSFICVVLFAREIEGWQQGILRLSTVEPAIDHILSIILRIGKKLGKMIRAYIKTQTIILICISVVATVGIYLGGVKEGWFYGILAGFMDFLPFIGTGIVLIPIGVVSLLKGRLIGACIILATYFVCVLIREFLEPRLLGDGMRFSPVAILISVYAGVIYYGIGGVVLGPVTLLILVELGKEIFHKRVSM